MWRAKHTVPRTGGRTSPTSPSHCFHSTSCTIPTTTTCEKIINKIGWRRGRQSPAPLLFSNRSRIMSQMSNAIDATVETHTAAGFLFRFFVIALTAFLTVVDLFATQAILPALAQHYGV